MNKTIKIIAIVLLVVGALAVVGGVCFAVVGRQLLGRGASALSLPNNPNFKGGNRPMMNDQNWSNGFRWGRGFGFFSLPFWFIGGGLTFLVAGVVLMIFKRRITASVEPDAVIKEKAPAKLAAAAKEKAPAAVKKSTKKKPA